MINIQIYKYYSLNRFNSLANSVVNYVKIKLISIVKVLNGSEQLYIALYSSEKLCIVLHSATQFCKQSFIVLLLFSMQKGRKFRNEILNKF